MATSVRGGAPRRHPGRESFFFVHHIRRAAKAADIGRLPDDDTFHRG
jgi:hypothetical protein